MVKYECPSCQIKKSDIFIKSLGNLVEPFLITNERKAFSRKFTFNERMLNLQTSRPENKKFIMIRCLKLDSKGYSLNWPYNASISVDREDIMKLELKGLYSKTRADYPIYYYFEENDLEDNYHYMNKKFARSHKELKETNEICVFNNWVPGMNDNFYYAVSIEIVEIIRNISDVVRFTKVEDDYVKLKNKFFSAEMEESVSISLLDCYTEKPIEMPARGDNCLHLAAFDLETYLIQNRAKKRYTCPICSKKITGVYVDKLVLDYIKKHKDKKEMLITKDMKVGELNGSALVTKSKEVIDLTDDLSDNEDTDMSSKKSPVRRTPENRSFLVTFEDNLSKKNQLNKKRKRDTHLEFDMFIRRSSLMFFNDFKQLSKSNLLGNN
jgi:hypothetical protein